MMTRPSFLVVCAAFLLAAFAGAPLARAGVWSVSPWTDDASTYIASGQTAWAYHFGSTSTATVNGVGVPGLAGGASPVSAAGQFSITGLPSVFNDDTNSVTGTGSAVMAKDCLYGGNPGSIQIQGLTVGERYTVSLFSVGFEDPGGRPVTFTSGTDTRVIDQDQFGDNAGIRVDYTFTATAATQTVTLTPQTEATWHLYALALRLAPRITVTSTADSGPGSLRQAIADAAVTIPEAVVINFAPALSGQTITLTSEIVIGKTVTLDGSSTAGVILDGGPGTNRLFTVSSGKSLTLVGLNLTGGGGGGSGLDTYGGAIQCQGTVSLTDCSLSGNSAFAGGAIFVANNGTASLTLLRCTLSGNTASYGGAVQNENLLTATSSTFADNLVTANGGAISSPFSSQVTLNHCTLSGNSANSGIGGAIIASQPLNASNTILAGNTAASAPNISGIIGLGTNNLTSGTPLLAPLGNYGGRTQTMALLPGSPARNAAPSSSITGDQRSFPIVGTPDIGAYEAGTTATNYNAWIWETLPATATEPQRATTFDFDGDGQINNDEWLALTNPGSASSRFAATPVLNGANLEITVPTAPGRNYTLLSSDTLLGGSWIAAPGFTPQAGTGGSLTFLIPVAGQRSFYRVQVTRP